jgi:hypothetical protein
MEILRGATTLDGPGSFVLLDPPKKTQTNPPWFPLLCGYSGGGEEFFFYLNALHTTPSYLLCNFWAFQQHLNVR